MTDNKHLFPTLKTDFINSETGELNIKYRPGHPRKYRFDASKGLFSVNGETLITKKGEPLTFIPICFRLFKDDILGFGLKKWVEFFFLNEGGQLCNLLFHGYSVENLERRTADLYYDEVNLTEVALTAMPIEKVKQNGEGKGSHYFVTEFSYKVLTPEQRTQIKTISELLNVWRADTLTGDATMELSVNFRPPIQYLNGSGSVGEIKELQKEQEATEQRA